MDEKQRREKRSQHGMLEFRGRLPRRLTARVLLGDDDRQIKDLSGKHAVSGGRADDAPRPTAADPASSMETQTLASLSILVPVATTWSKPWMRVPDDEGLT